MQSSNYEQQLRHHHHRKRTLFLDWDGTLTQESTLGLIAAIRPDAPPLTSFTKAYEADLAQHADQWRPVPRETSEDKAKHAASQRAVELASIRRLEAAGIWNSVTGPAVLETDGGRRGSTVQCPFDVEQAARNAVAGNQIRLRPGAMALLHAARRRGDDIVIISLSWSGTWIAACLIALGIPAVSAAVHPGSTMVHDHVVVIANEIDPMGSGHLSRGQVAIGGGSGLVFDGNGETGLWTAKDKADQAGAWMAALGKATSAVCIGDSLGDLLMLEYAEEAIIVVDSERTQEQRELDEELRRRKWMVRDIETCTENRELFPDNTVLRVTHNLQPVVEYLYGTKAGA